MARLSLILAHPRHGSFNHAIAATVVHTLETQGHEVWFHDLYQENFDPVLVALCSPATQGGCPVIPGIVHG